MDKFNSQIALDLLFKDVILKKEDISEDKNRWVRHCIYVGIAAGRIAERLGLDEDYAIALGYIHDVGRKISHSNHVIDGYHYMVERGYVEEARSCLTHSFIDNNIYNAADKVSGPQERFDFINGFLESIELTPYDNIVQMCDLFCLETGFTTVEKRMLDIYVRKGIYETSKPHFEKVMELKSRLESQIGCSLYDLFPEISPSVLESINADREEIMQCFRNFESNGKGQILAKKNDNKSN